MIDKIEVFKQNHIKINANGKDVRIDPFQTDTADNSADFILITHDHRDHFSVRDIERTACEKTVLAVPETMKDKAEAVAHCVRKIVTVVPGNSYNIDGLEFETVPAYNIGKPFHPKSAGWVGYILKVNGERIYVAGDTDKTEEALAVKCDIAIVPAGGTYTMNAGQAADLVNSMKPKVAIPVHYGGIVGSKKDGMTFKTRVNKEIDVVLKIKF